MCRACSTLSEMLADTSVTENSMMQFLGVIEQRTNEIIQSLAALAQSASSGSGSSPFLIPTAPLPSHPLVRGNLGVKVSPPASPGPGATLVSLLGHGPATQHGTEVMTAVDPPKVEDWSSVSALAHCRCSCSPAMQQLC